MGFSSVSAMWSAVYLKDTFLIDASGSTRWLKKAGMAFGVSLFLFKILFNSANEINSTNVKNYSWIVKTIPE